ncbi:hypothetical protein [Clostridium neonatale]|uniref:hypothetical protein n=1 Tax=Clostridium neonatale TaxID=137838 RepID=UPI00291C44B7|nr:hypothetical protein [Clostridium neonatale]CAI3573423.1 conserved hypothetical protein [Clostridium neonatale]CAI3654699.1 conserved hypothetical protein [Clostridium neonatale]
MAKIIAPNKSYTGVSASVAFCNGEGNTTNPILIDWFKKHGYEVIEDAAEERVKVPPTDDEVREKQLSEMDAEELKAYAEEKGIDIGKATSEAGILEKIKESEDIE